MAISKNIKVEFIADFSNNKKGDVKEFSKDISNIFINDLKVAKLYSTKEVKEVKVKPKKDK
jgi:hypothetical protein